MHLIPFDPTASIAETDDHPAQAPDIVGRWILGQVWYTLRRRSDGCYVLKVRNPHADISARYVLRDDDMCNLFVLSETVPTQNAAFGLAVARVADELYEEMITCRR